MVPLPEDIALLAAGITLNDPAAFVGLVLGGIVGLLIRDSVFFLTGHFVGEGVFRWRAVQRLIGEERITKGRGLVERQGGRAVLVSRFLVGARAAGFLVSGALGVRVRDFYLWDLLGLMVTVPVWLLLGFAFGDPIVGAMGYLLDHAMVVLGGLAILGVGWLGFSRWRPAVA